MPIKIVRPPHTHTRTHLSCIGMHRSSVELALRDKTYAVAVVVDVVVAVVASVVAIVIIIVVIAAVCWPTLCGTRTLAHMCSPAQVFVERVRLCV